MLVGAIGAILNLIAPIWDWDAGVIFLAFPLIPIAFGFRFGYPNYEECRNPYPRREGYHAQKTYGTPHGRVLNGVSMFPKIPF